MERGTERCEAGRGKTFQKKDHSNKTFLKFIWNLRFVFWNLKLQIMARPDLSRVPEFYHKYINHVPENDLMTSFKNQTQVFIDFLKTIPAEKIDYAYAPGKWTIRAARLF